uniref:Uncharacterized protein n=1 Tax=Meloidogyne hapla TaxID=6305 RepID=A0A1I8BEJ2_MELHA
MAMEKFDEKMSEFIKLRITFKQNEVEHFIEIIFNYLNKLMGNQKSDKIKHYAEKLIKVNFVALNNLFFELDMASNQIGVYLSKILKDKITINCNKWINNEGETEENNEKDEKITAVRRFCQFGMLMSLGKFFTHHLIKFEKKMIVELKKMINNSIQIGLNAVVVKEKNQQKEAKIAELEENVLIYENFYFPIWNRAKEIIIGYEIIKEENKEEVFYLFYKIIQNLSVFFNFDFSVSSLLFFQDFKG